MAAARKPPDAVHHHHHLHLCLEGGWTFRTPDAGPTPPPWLATLADAITRTIADSINSVKGPIMALSDKVQEIKDAVAAEKEQARAKLQDLSDQITAL